MDFSSTSNFHVTIISSEEELLSDASIDVEVRRVLRRRTISSSDESEKSEEDDNNIKKAQDEEWLDPTGNQPRLTPFANPNKSELKISGDLNKVENYYSLFVTDEIFEEIANYTNLYAMKLVSQKEMSNLNKWYPTSTNEIKRFFALIMWMGLVKLPELHLYWSRDPSFAQMVPRSIMQRHRFELLIQTLYFTHEDKGNFKDSLDRVRQISDALNKNFTKYYDPPETLCINESVIPLHDRIAFKQRVKRKIRKYNVKIYKLCSKSGYTYNFEMYYDERLDAKRTIPTNTFISLCKNIFGKGHTVYADNWCTSVDLAQKLIAENTHLVGRIRSNSRGISQEVVSKRLKRRTAFAKEHKNGVTLLKWNDERDVLLLSTKHSTETVLIKNKGRDGFKPKLIFDYNKEKTSDISERMTCFNSLQKSVKWYRKLALELILNVSVVNAWVIYNSVKNHAISIVEFKKQLITYLSDCYNDDERSNIPHYQNRGRDVLLTIPKDRHELKRNEGKRSSRRGRCIYCYKQYCKSFGPAIAKHRSKQVGTYCDDCPKKPFLCLTCFKTTHRPRTS